MVFGPGFLANMYVSYPSIELEYDMKMLSPGKFYLSSYHWLVLVLVLVLSF